VFLRSLSVEAITRINAFLGPEVRVGLEDSAQLADHGEAVSRLRGNHFRILVGHETRSPIRPIDFDHSSDDDPACGNQFGVRGAAVRKPDDHAYAGGITAVEIEAGSPIRPEPDRAGPRWPSPCERATPPTPEFEPTRHRRQGRTFAPQRVTAGEWPNGNLTDHGGPR
jgi:hypothetical protein